MLGLSGTAYFILVVIIALAGRRRTIGFGWPFLLGVLFTPIVSLVAVLLSDKLPNGDTRWGCLWPLVVMLLLLILAIPVLLLFGAAIMAFFASVADTGGMLSI